MKLYFRIVICFVILFSFSEAKAQISAGGGIVYGTDINNIGISLNGNYEINEKWSAAPSFTYFLKKDYVTWSALDLDANYQLTEIEKFPDPTYRIVKDSRQNLFLVRFEQYPCFDSSDRMYENRYYRYLFYCKDREELEEKFQYLKDKRYLSYGAIDNHEFIPNIFYGDDSLFFQIAE